MSDRCALCPGVNACIPPHGPEDADCLFIGEAPGYQENKYALKHPPGFPFIGKTGQEVDRHYLPLAGLRRDSVRVTNAIRCLPISSGGKLDPNRRGDVELLHSCAEQFLLPEMERGHLRAVIPLGSFACRAIVPDVSLDIDHGIPHDTEWGIPAFPMYHPALGIHEPKKMLHIRTDWWKLRRFLNGSLEQPMDGYPETDYQEVTDADELEALDPTRALACDTESTRDHQPYCLTYSQAPGTGRLIRATRHDILSLLGQKLGRGWHAPILFHNWLYDWPVTEAMGLHIPHRLVVDTMARAYHLGNLPQGLKALSSRELGMIMQSFDDVVTPHSSALVLRYYREAYGEPWPKPEPQQVRDEQGGWKVYKPQSMTTKLKRFFTDYTKNPNKDIFDMWTKNWREEQAQIEAKMGPWPGKCISHVPFEEALHYACRDADATLRLWGVLQRMATMTRRRGQEHWRHGRRRL